ncbi:MAG: aconitate hydratase AcnA [Pirellulales bacterium]
MASDRSRDMFGARDTFNTSAGKIGIYRLSKLEQLGLCRTADLPYSIRILLEAVLRNCDGYIVTEEDVKGLAGWKAAKPAEVEVPFMPSRVVLQDFTGVPCVVDLAHMRSRHEPARRQSEKDQSVDSGRSRGRPFRASRPICNRCRSTTQRRTRISAQRRTLRISSLGPKALNNFRVVPPGLGIVHQVNLEYLAKCVWVRDDGLGPCALPDTLVGTDSHTTMINGLGVLGWGVGGIEAEAGMLGQPLYMLMPEVIGVELTGVLPAGATATDMVLTVTQMLRKEGVVNKFVEFCGPGVSTMKLADRATIANMAPEYGATMGFFPIDDETLDFLHRTGRSEADIELVERYMKEQGLFRTDDAPVPTFTKLLKLDLATVEPSLAGPKRPQDRVALKNVKKEFHASLTAPIDKRGFALDEAGLERVGTFVDNGHSQNITHGAVVIAAITSCTNTSNPSVMLGAGLLAKKAVAKGLAVKPYVKTSLAPGSRVVADYLEKAGVMDDLKQLGFHIVGYGCTTCIGNSGPLPDPVAKAVVEGNLVASAVLSGNRNFEGRVNPHVKANYLASPPLVVAYALAGSTEVDLASEPLGTGKNGEPVYLKDVWPSQEEVRDAVEKCVLPEMFQDRYSDVFNANPHWNAINVAESDLFTWHDASTYIQEPPFLIDLPKEPSAIKPINGARALAVLGDSVTTDHISPAGNIAKASPAGKFLMEKGVQPVDFNSYGARRGNDRVMTRGTFANIRIRNHMVPGVEGGVTRHLPSGEQLSIYDAAMKYKADGVPLVVLAGAEYGTGSSRDWAAKGTYLLGVRAVISQSFERIHRSNLVGMGILPLEFAAGQTWQSLGLTGEETFDFLGLDDNLKPRSMLKVRATKPDGKVTEFEARVRIDSQVERDYYRNGGILQTVLRKLLAEA